MKEKLNSIVNGQYMPFTMAACIVSFAVAIAIGNPIPLAFPTLVFGTHCYLSFNKKEA